MRVLVIIPAHASAFEHPLRPAAVAGLYSAMSPFNCLPGHAPRINLDASRCRTDRPRDSHTDWCACRAMVLIWDEDMRLDRSERISA